jgi:serine/threonine protein kinase
MSTLAIELLHLNEQTQPLLWRLIEQNPAKFLWKKNKKYAVRLSNGEEQIITLSHALLKRHRKLGKVREPRYEIVNNIELDKGGYGTVITSQATLIPNSVEQTFRYSRDQIYLPGRQARRVIKFVSQERDDPKKNLQTEMERESELLVQADNMKSKPLIMVSPKKAALVMEHLGGMTLYELLYKNKHGQLDLTIDDLFQLSIAFWEALLTQVTERGLIHKDLKPENVMVEKIDGKFKITIMDFGSSRRINDPTLNTFKKSGGSLGFAAPEQYDDNPEGFKVSPASDVYSGGVSVAQIWDDGDRKKLFPDSRIANQYNKLFEGLGDFAESRHANNIRDILKKTLFLNPEERISAKAALDQFRQLYETYRHDVYSDQFKHLKEWIETRDWEIKKPQRRKRSIVTAEGEKRVPFHVHELWKEVDALLNKNPISVEDYEMAEKRILSLGKNAADHSNFFRRTSTKKVYSQFRGVESLGALLLKLDPPDPASQLHL